MSARCFLPQLGIYVLLVGCCRFATWIVLLYCKFQLEFYFIHHSKMKDLPHLANCGFSGTHSSPYSTLFLLASDLASLRRYYYLVSKISYVIINIRLCTKSLFIVLNLWRNTFSSWNIVIHRTTPAIIWRPTHRKRQSKAAQPSTRTTHSLPYTPYQCMVSILPPYATREHHLVQIVKHCTPPPLTPYSPLCSVIRHHHTFTLYGLPPSTLCPFWSLVYNTTSIYAYIEEASPHV